MGVQVRDQKLTFQTFPISIIKKLYVLLIKSLLGEELNQQRFKLIWFIWGYFPLFKIKQFTLGQKLNLLKKFLKVDWFVLHGHRPQEICEVAKVFALRKALPGEIMIEAGTYNGGSAAKFSFLCEMQGYTLHIFDSFEGVEPLSPELYNIEWDFAGEYAATEEYVWNNLKKYGAPEVCKTIKGWYSNTMNSLNVKDPVRVVYIDCDLAKGTKECLDAIAPKLTKDAVIFSQDYQFPTVRALLNDSNTWLPYGKGIAEVKYLCWNLASIKFPEPLNINKVLTAK